jgi:PhnB protein
VSSKDTRNLGTTLANAEAHTPLLHDFRDYFRAGVNSSLRAHRGVTAQKRQMGSWLNPYLSFDGNARQAMEFYQGVFGGTLNINTFGEFGAQDAAEADKVMHSQLETPSGFTLMASDTPAGIQRNPGDNISISLSGDDAEPLRGYWQKLSDGGTVTMPLEKQMWGDEFGMCVDRFGVPWMVNITLQQS